MTAPDAAAYVVIGFIFVGGCGALVWAITGWRRTTAAIGQDGGGAAPEECLYCRCLYMDSDCTCPRRCTAMVCLAEAS